MRWERKSRDRETFQLCRDKNLSPLVLHQPEQTRTAYANSLQFSSLAARCFGSAYVMEREKLLYRCPFVCYRAQCQFSISKLSTQPSLPHWGRAISAIRRYLGDRRRRKKKWQLCVIMMNGCYRYKFYYMRRRHATAEPIAEYTGVSKNKSLLASRVHFCILSAPVIFLFFFFCASVCWCDCRRTHPHKNIPLTSFIRSGTCPHLTSPVWMKWFAGSSPQYQKLSFWGGPRAVNDDSADGNKCEWRARVWARGDGANVLYTSACLINVKINWV